MVTTTFNSNALLQYVLQHIPNHLCTDVGPVSMQPRDGWTIIPDQISVISISQLNQVVQTVISHLVQHNSKYSTGSLKAVKCPDGSVLFSMYTVQ